MMPLSLEDWICVVFALSLFAFRKQLSQFDREVDRRILKRQFSESVSEMGFVLLGVILMSIAVVHMLGFIGFDAVRQRLLF